MDRGLNHRFAAWVLVSPIMPKSHRRYDLSWVGCRPYETYRSGVESRDEFLHALGRRVRDLRAAAGLTQEHLGERAGISAKYLSGIENGTVNVSVGVLHALAEGGFGLSVTALLNFDLEWNEAKRLEAEIATLIAGQPVEARRRALRALDAFFGDGVLSR